MKIVIIGGTGLIGSIVAKKLRQLGHTVIAGSPSTGINALTGEGLSTALENTDVVIDLSNSATPEEATAVNFFRTAGKNLVEMEKAAGVKHHLVLSIVGTDRAPYIGYLRAKKEQEDIIRQSGIPFTIIRSTQFHEHISTIIAVQSEGDEVHVSTLDYQPIAAEDVATFVTQFSLEGAKNDTVEIAGPERALMNEFVTAYLKIREQGKVVAVNNENRYMFFVIPKSGLVPEGAFSAGRIRFEEWAKE